MPIAKRKSGLSAGRAGGRGKRERRKEGKSEATCKLWVVLLLLLLPTPPERGSPVQGPGEKAEGYSQTRLHAAAHLARYAVLRWMSLKAAALRAWTSTGARDVREEVVVEKTKGTMVGSSRCWPATHGKREGVRCATGHSRSNTGCRNWSRAVRVC